MSSTFEWRANNDNKEGQASNHTLLDTGDGSLFVCSPSTPTPTQPTLTLVTAPSSTTREQQEIADNNNTATIVIQPSPGDDLSPPNAVQATNMNGIALPVSASAGWSQSPPKEEGIFPCAVEYDVRLKTNNTTNENNKAISDSLELQVSLEYSNPRFDQGESMLVNLSIAKTLVHAETGVELALVATQFQEYIINDNNEHWMDITADVEYTETANTVVDAVLADPAVGQTAGKATINAKTMDLTLGPFSAKARFVLTFQAEQLVTYDAMSVTAPAAAGTNGTTAAKHGSLELGMGTHRLLPLWVTLPFAPIDQEEGLSSVSVRFQAPTGTSVLPLDEFQEAYWHLKQQGVMKTSTILAVSELVPQQQLQDLGSSNNSMAIGGTNSTRNTTLGYQYQWDSLPPRSCGILAWLALPNAVDDDSDNDDLFDFVHIGRSLEELDTSLKQQPPATETNKAQAHAVLQIPKAEDIASLQVPLPGHGPTGSLWRLKIKMPEAQPRQSPALILNIALSDKSGSTGRIVGGGGQGSPTMRQRFNELAEVRFLKRLESIPALVRADVLRLDDVWMDVFLAFDSAAPRAWIHRVTFCVKDVVDSIVEVVQAIRASNIESAGTKLAIIYGHVGALRSIKPGGLTNFGVGPNTLVQEFSHWQREARALVSQQKLLTCSFVEFDTDGGHNGSENYLKSLQYFCDICDVRSGVVTGFGSWLNQDCASKVARTLGSVPAQLTMQVPEPGTEGLDTVFRRGFSAWVDALRKPPNLTVTVSAGSVSIPTARSTRDLNAVELLALRRTGERHGKLPQFMAPDVSNDSYTKTRIGGVPAGDEIMLYFVCRLESASQLAEALNIETSVEGGALQTKASVRADDEETSGGFLAFDWLTMLTTSSGAKGFQVSPLVASLGSRLEDEVSFRFNIASPSGRTSYLGRCKTVADRAAIDDAHQPASPSSPLQMHPPMKEAPEYRVRRHQQTLHFQSHFASFDPSMTSVTALQFSSTNAQRFNEPTRSVGIQQDDFIFQQALFTQRLARSDRMPSVQSASRGKRVMNKAARCEEYGRKRGFAPERCRRQGAWIDALAVPVGVGSNKVGLPLSKQDYDDLKRALGTVDHAAKRLMGSVSVNYICDVCQRPFAGSENRYHCFDCRDFDACTLCKDGHKFALHRMALAAPNARPNTAATTANYANGDKRDPLVDMLLEPTSISAPTIFASLPIAVATLEPSIPSIDQTMVWCEHQVRRFLLSVLHWWPLFRGTCVFRDELPEAVTEDLAKKIAQCCCNGDNGGGSGDDNLKAMLNTLSIIADSLVQQDTAYYAKQAK